MEDLEELDDEISAAVRGFAGQMRSDSHVPPEDLLAYQEGQLAEVDNEAIRDHLATCPRCAGLILDLARFSRTELGEPLEEELSDSVLEERWEVFRPRLEGEPRSGSAPVPAPRELPDRPPRNFPRRELYAALAAGLVAVSLGLAFRAGMWHQRHAERSEPAVRVAVSSLLPQEMAAARNPGAAEPTVVPVWADRLLLILNFFAPSSYPTYRARILDATGREVWSSRDLRRASDGSFALEVPRSFLPAGSYRIELSGLAGARQNQLAVYRLLLQLD